LNGFPYFPFSSIRYPGVLQRIAVCYLIAASIFLFLRVRGIIVITVALLVSYWLLMTLVPVPECGAGSLTKDCNLAKYVDGLVLSGHMWSQTKTWDPEGIISTIPAIATTLFGILMGYVVRSKFAPTEKTVWMFVMGILLLWAGSIMNNWLPINKNLWTSSYSVFMAGLASIVFALCYWTVDVLGYRRWTRPFAIYGMNAIAVFILTGVIGRLLGIIKIGAMPLETWIFNSIFLPLASPLNASLLYAIANVLFYYSIVYFMYRRGWFPRF
jgi:predicted acyltransferase